MNKSLAPKRATSNTCLTLEQGNGYIAQWLERRTRNQKGSEFDSQQEQREIFSSDPGSTFCADSYFGVRSTAVLRSKLK